jgi:putative SOS response-associated peptidase YedK
MCGRYTFTVSRRDLATHFQVPEPELPFVARYNVAPTQQLPIIRQPADGGRELALTRWGLIPSWAKDAKIGNRLINARAETVANAPAFRSAFKARRCLVPADGFYEWQKRSNGSKQPFHFHFQDGRPFAFAGLWEHWHSPDGELVVAGELQGVAAFDRGCPRGRFGVAGTVPGADRDDRGAA